MKRFVAAGAVGLLAIGGVVTTLNSQSGPAMCVASQAPVSTTTIIQSPVFDSAIIADPVLAIGFDTDLADRSRYFVEYLSADKKTTLRREALDPADLQFLERRDNGARVIDLRGVSFDSSLGLSRIVIEAPATSVDLPKLEAAARVMALGNQPFNVVNPLTSPNFVMGQPIDSAQGLTPAQAATLRDAIVMIVNDADKWRCNGTYLGNGQVLTAGHCSGGDLRVIFGSIWEEKDKRLNGEIACPAHAGKISPASDARARPMDIAVLDIAPNFSTLAGARFAGAKATLDRREPPPASYRLAAIWTGVRGAVAVDASGKAYIPEYLKKQLFAPPTVPPAGSAASWCQTTQANVLDGCVANQHQSLSPAGWVHRCPVIEGLSGAPLFDAGNTNLSVVAVVSGDSATRPDNCATPTFFLPKF